MKRIVKPDGTITITTTNFFQDLLWQPSRLWSFIFKRNYPHNSEKRIKEVLNSLGLSSRIEFITFRPKQSYLKYINKRVFPLVMSHCLIIEKLLHFLRFERLCSIIVIRIGENETKRRKTKLKFKDWISAPFALIVFIGLVIFHWIFDVRKNIWKLPT